MKITKKILALILAGIMVLALLASCGDTADPDNTTDPDNNPSEGQPGEEGDPIEGEEEEEPEAPGFDASTITANTYGAVNASTIAYLSFEGSTAALNLISYGEDKSISGECEVTEETIKIGDTTFTYKFVASYLTLQDGDIKYQLSKAADSAKDAEYKGAYTLATNSWSGGGASLAFDGATATIKIDGTKVDYNGTYTFESPTALTVVDTSSGNPDNLAIGCETFASSTETADLIDPLAVDGDYTTRFASAYEDPSFITINLGSKKTVGAVSLYWETACGKEFNIEVSDDNENWTAVVEEKENAAYGTATDPVGVSYEFDPVETQYVRMYGIVRGTSYGYSLYEFEVYEKLLGEANVTIAYDGDKVNLTYDGTTYSLTK